MSGKEDKRYEKIASFLILFVIPVPIVVLYWRAGFFPTHDGIIHIIRIEQFHKSFAAGQIPVRLAPELLGGAGYPLFVINNQLPYYLAEPFLFLGLSSVQAYRILILTAYCFYSLFSFIFFSKLGGRKGGLLATILISYSPYLFANMFTRGALAEILGVSIIPLGFLAVHRLPEVSFLAFTLGLMLLSHTLVAGAILPFILLYSLIVFRKKWRVILKRLLLALGWAFGIAAFGILPAILERSYFVFNNRIMNIWRSHLLNPFSIFRLPFSGASIFTPYQVGFFPLIILLLTLVIIFYRRPRKYLSLYLFFIGMFLLNAFLSSSWSASVWRIIPFLSLIVFPWRLLSLVSFASAALAALIFGALSKKYRWLLIVISVLAVYSSRHYWKPTVFPKEFVEQQNQFTTATTENEYDPIGMDKKIGNFDIPDLQILSGKGKISDKQKSVGRLHFRADIEQESLIQANILYFPGWRLLVDGSPQFINTQVPSETTEGLNGLISFWLPEGVHQVDILLTETPLRMLANLISGFSLLMLLVKLIKELIKRFVYLSVYWFCNFL